MSEAISDTIVTLEKRRITNISLKALAKDFISERLAIYSRVLAVDVGIAKKDL